MMRVLTCLGGQHVLWLVALAAMLCVATCSTAIRTFSRAMWSRGAGRAGWILMAGVASGAGAWATHFLAMLAYNPGLPTAFSANLTALSLNEAVVATTAGCAIAALGQRPIWRCAGGAVIGLGIAAMHYIGMAAFQTEGTIEWGKDLVAASVVICGALSAFSFGILSAARNRQRIWLATATFTLGILLLHFIGMGAIVILPDPRIAVPPKSVSDAALAVAISVIAVLILGAGNAMDLVYTEARGNMRKGFHAFVDASVDGVAIVVEDKIVHANEQFCRLLQAPREELIGRRLCGELLQVSDRAAHPPSPIIENGTLKAAQDAEIPVEVLARPMIVEGADYVVYSLRDLREKQQALSKIRYFSEHDALTGLPNRALFQLRLQSALKRSDDLPGAAVLFVDLERFKEVNDIFGHGAGDAILRGVGTRLRALTREGTFVARLSGDEFAVMQESADSTTAEALAREIVTQLSAPFVFGGERIALGCRIGIALSPQDGTTPNELFARAEIALQRAKSSGRGTHCFFDAALDEDVHDQRALAFDLTHAIAEGQLEVYYQPLSLIPSMQIVGFEALLRWHHPVRGMISPAVFIPIAEETQIICELGAWILRTVCAEAASWANPLKVSVNLSPVQLGDPALPETMQEILFTTGMTADRLELEVTETALMRNPQRALDVLRRLKALGIRIAMDDFGTGYSSLSTLQAFPFDKIKIDKSFVERVDTHGQAASIVKAVLSLGRSLKIPVLVEGVETQRQLDFLAREGAEEIQGYLVGRPQPIALYGALIATPPGKAGAEPAREQRVK
jgi:diguanylate cyclase (GGDEF)-like protein